MTNSKESYSNDRHNESDQIDDPKHPEQPSLIPGVGDGSFEHSSLLVSYASMSASTPNDFVTMS